MRNKFCLYISFRWLYTVHKSYTWTIAKTTSTYWVFQFFSSASFLCIFFHSLFAFILTYIISIHPSVCSHYIKFIQADFLSINSGFTIRFLRLGMRYIRSVYGCTREWNEMPFAWNEFYLTVMFGTHTHIFFSRNWMEYVLQTNITKILA